MQKDTLRTVISTILSFMMMVCLSLLALLIGLYFTIFQVNFIVRRMNDRYFDSVMQSLTKQLQDEIAPPSGFPDVVFENLFTRASVESDSRNYVQAVLGNLTYTLDTTKLRDDLVQRFTDYAVQNNLSYKKENLESLAQICIDEYERQITVPFLKSFSSVRLMYERYFPYALLGLSTFLIVLVLFLFRIQPFKHRAVRYCIYSLFASALMVIPVPLWVLIQGAYAKMNISPEHMRMLFVSSVRTTLLVLVIIGVILWGVACALLPLVRHMRGQLIAESYKRYRDKR